MTTAVCTQCGGTKFGALCPCDRCGITPSSTSEKAKSVLLSDHYYTLNELNELGKAVKSGEPIAYDPALLAIYERALDCLEFDPESLQCKVCGDDLDSFDETHCPSCWSSMNEAE
jgi:hypothetical protein